MSTEKSLLTIKDVKFPKIDHGLERDGLYFPVGVTPCGNLEVAHLSQDEGTSHVCVFGVCGSGKTKYVEFVIKALYQMYGNNITLHFLDGKDCEYSYWLKQDMPFKRISNCSTLNSFENELDEILRIVAEKTTNAPELCVIDDASVHLSGEDARARAKLWNLYVEGSKKNVHIMYASQAPRGSLSGLQVYFGLICVTRACKEVSSEIFGSVIASNEAGVRRYGDLTYSYCGNVSRVRVPFCENERIENHYD